MADHAKPILTDNYTNVLSQIRGRFEDQAKGFDPANTTATNVVTGTIRWNSAENKFQKWSGTTWGDLTTNYVLSSVTLSTGTPNGVAYLNGSKVLTTGSALTFDGTNLATTGKVTAGGAVLSGFGTGTAGGNLEMGWDGTQTIVQGYNRTSSAYVPLWLESNYTRFGINATEQMRLTSTGLGIGTSSPAYKLDVNGTGRIGTAIFDTSGNLGLGVTPSAWGVTSHALQLNGSGSAVSFSLYSPGATNGGGLVSNAYYNSGWKYIYLSGVGAGRYEIEAGQHSWFSAGTGTAGAAISFTQVMTLDASGNLLVGNTNGTSRITATGVIESTSGGFKFPDGTTQTTAGINPAKASVGAIGTMAMCKYTGTGSVSFGATKNSSELQYSDLSGTIVTVLVDGNTWRCLGRCSDASNAQRVTLWVRVS